MIHTTSHQIALSFALMTACMTPLLWAADNPPSRDSSLAVSNVSQWPRFRGPNGLGLSDADIPAQWTEKDFNWKITLPGGGHSSPVVWGDRIFLLCGNDQTGEHMVVCVNAKDGSIRWNRAYPAHTYSHHQYNSYASSSPAVDEKHVYVCWSTPEEFTVMAFDHDGNEIWKNDLGEFISQHGGGQSPIAYRNMVVVGDDQEGPQSFLFAFDRDSGRTLWKIPRGHSDKFSASTPCVLEPKDGPPELIFTSKKHGFTALDPQSGRKIWELDQVFDSRTVASPYIADGLIFCNCGDGPSGHAMVAVRPADDGKSAKVAWDLHRAVPYVPTSIVVNNLLFYFTDNGVMTCAEPDTGKPIWKHRLDGNFFGSPVCARDKIFILSKEGDAYVFAASRTFRQLARNPLNFEDPNEQHPPLATTPAIAGGHMYIRTYTHLVSIGGNHS
ncbi:MAG TPA: PQQ-binding-like beta-propeller repeat protein [Tepidisphaeraceae bacterium]|nr:PQQ-binding-like beta-propeller repeat protein [Tepidisphaeraceae bacterium]